MSVAIAKLFFEGKCLETWKKDQSNSTVHRGRKWCQHNNIDSPAVCGAVRLPVSRKPRESAATFDKAIGRVAILWNLGYTSKSGLKKFGRRTERDVQVKIIFRITPCKVFWVRLYQLDVQTSGTYNWETYNWDSTVLFQWSESRSSEVKQVYVFL